MARKRMIYVSLDDEVVNMIDKLTESKMGKLERSSVIRQLIKIGLREALKDAEKFVEEVNSSE